MDEALASFTSITGTTPDRAQQYLNLTDGIVEQAIELFYTNDGLDLEAATTSTNAQPASQVSSMPADPTHSADHQQSYEDDQGVVHLDYDADANLTDEQQAPASAGTRRRQPRRGSGRTDPRVPNDAISSADLNETHEDDEAVARRLQEEFYGAAPPGMGGGEVDADGVRAPIARTTETLVGPDSFGASDETEMHAAVLDQMRSRRQRAPRERPGVFNQVATNSIWNATDESEGSRRDRLARATAGASERDARSNMLAEMYRPPFELMSDLSWNQARQHGKQEEKWLLVNIQDPSIFDCQVLNRDIWKNPSIKETVEENFVFMQYTKHDPRGSQYVQYYFPNSDSPDAYIHIAIVDPRTGEQVKVWSAMAAPKAPDFLMQLHEFLDRYSLKASAKNPVARRKPEVRKETQIDKMTEEQMLEMAMQNSLVPAESSRRNSDPDALTRSVDHISSQNDPPMVEPEVGHANTNGSSNSTFTAISAVKPHIEPAVDSPSTRIQFRYPSGRVVRRFAISDPVRRLYEWLKASPVEGKDGVEFALICVGKNLIDHLDSTIEQAGLKNSSVMVEFNE